MYHQPRINLRSLIGLLIQWLLFVTYAKTFPTAFALRCSVLHWPKEGILSYAPLETTFDCVAGNIGRPLRTTNTTHHARASDVVIDTPLIGTGSHLYCSLIQPHKSPRRASVAGAAALVPRGGCLFVHKLELLSRVGATVALVYNTNSDAPFAADGPQADRDDDDDQELNDIIDPLRDVSLEGYPADSEQEPTAHMPMPPTNNEHMSVFIMISEEAGTFLEALVADDNPDRATVVGGTSRRETEVRLIVSRAVTKRSISKLTPGGNHDTTTLTTQSFDSFSRSTHTRTGRTRRGRTRRRRIRSPVGATVYSPSTVSVEDDKLPNMFAEPTVHDVTNKPVSFHGFFAGGLMDLKVGEPGGIGRTVKRNNETIQVDHKVTMLEADEGSSFTVAVTRRQLCSMCDGQGALPTAMVPCPACKADEAGVMEMSHPLGHTCRQHREVTCPVCAGHGEVIGVGESPCPHCGGKRVVSENTILNVTIPPGVKNLHEIVLSGAGHAKPLYQPGDVIVIVHVDRDARYVSIHRVCKRGRGWGGSLTRVFGVWVEPTTLAFLWDDLWLPECCFAMSSPPTTNDLSHDNQQYGV